MPAVRSTPKEARKRRSLNTRILGPRLYVGEEGFEYAYRQISAYELASPFADLYRERDRLSEVCVS